MSSIFPTRSKPKTLTMKVMLQTEFLKPYLSLFLSSVGHSLDINTSTRGFSWTKPGLELMFNKGEKDKMVTRDEKREYFDGDWWQWRWNSKIIEGKLVLACYNCAEIDVFLSNLMDICTFSSYFGPSFNKYSHCNTLELLFFMYA